VSVNVAARQGGRPLVVLVAVDGLAPGLWDATEAALRNGNDVQRLDLPAVTAVDQGLEDLERALVGVPPCHLVAHSAAAPVAWRWAAAHTDLVLSLSLAGAFARLDGALLARLSSWEAALAADGPELGRTVAAPWLWGREAFEEGGPANGWVGGGPGEDEQRAFLQLAKAVGDQRKWLRALPCPVLVAVGSDDALAPMRYSHEIVEWVRHGVLVTVTLGGHLAPLEKPGEWTRVLSGFIARHAEFVSGPQEWEDLEEDDSAPFQLMEGSDLDEEGA
jgi:pimeloyl-ACP methyl ester carboxylesterase